MRLLLRDLQPGTNYELQVRAKKQGASSEWSPKFEFTTISANVPPKAPINITWGSVGSSFHGEWDIVTSNEENVLVKVDRYEVELTGASVVAFSSVPQVSEGKVIFDFSFEENLARFLAPQSSISIRVRAIDTHGLASEWSASVSATNDPPPTPTGFTADGISEFINLGWNAVSASDLAGYRVYLSVDGGTTFSRIYQGDGLNYAFPSSMYSTDHYFYVVSFDIFGLESDHSATAGPVRPTSGFSVDTTPPDAPTGVTMTISNGADGSPGTGNVAWTLTTVPDDLAGFNVRWRKAGGTEWQSTTVDKDTRSVAVLLGTAYVNYEAQVRAYDWGANYSAWSSIATGTAASNTAPPTPTSPNCSASTLNIQVRPTGTKAAGGGAMDADVEYYEVYASQTTPFTTYDATTMLGVIPVGPAMIGTFPVPANNTSGSTQPWYVKVIAVDQGGMKSPASAQSTASPNLIDTSNIVNLAVTDAKIQSLGVDKLVAGNGIINDLAVKSTLTVGTSTTNGYIQSWDYVAGSMGYRLERNNLEINQGSISAAALRIQNGKNLLKPSHADFEFNASSMASFVSSAGTTTLSIDTGLKKFNSQSLKTVSTGASWFWLGTSNADFNEIIVEPSKSYIISFYAMVPAGGTAQSITPVMRYSIQSSSADSSGTAQAIPADGVWYRRYTTVTTGATATGTAAVWFNLGAGTAYFDGIQVEEKQSSLDTPSTWSPPGSTSISGDLIRTGSIISSNTTTVGGSTVPMWSIPMNGFATFNGLTVRGVTTLGVSGDAGNSLIKSWNYTGVGGTGWMMDANGNLVANSGTFGGTLSAATGSFAGSISAAYGTFTGTVSGATVQTSGASTYVVRMDSAGLRAYASDSVTPVFNFKISDGSLYIGGNATFAGSLASGVNITSPTINGGTLTITDPSDSSTYTTIANGQITFNDAGKIDPHRGLSGRTMGLRMSSGTSGTGIGYVDVSPGGGPGTYSNATLSGETITLSGAMTGSLDMSGQNINNGNGITANYIKGPNGYNPELRFYDAGGSILGRLLFGGGSNIVGKFRTLSDTGTCISLDGSTVVAGLATYNATAATSSNTAGFWAWKVNAFNAFNNASDVREKDNIEDVDPEFAIDVVKRARARSYTMNRDDRKQYGVIAQEFMELLPSAIGNNGAPEDDEDFRYTMHYQDLHMMNLVATQALIEKNETLEARIEELERLFQGLDK